MSNAAKLKKRAAELEQKRQYDKALALYIQVLDESDASDEEADAGLYNRVGDLLSRLGRVSDALSYYEKASDLYAERGFLSNAIALCNKVLRQSPGRTSVYYKLGKISASKGFKSDAKRNFLEYADRMRSAGNPDEAFRALKEFADLCPDQDDVRLMLAEQLSREDRRDEALEQLQTLHAKLESEGRSIEARATLERMQALDPSIAPRRTEEFPVVDGRDLVFLDVSYDEPVTPTSVARRTSPPGAPAIAAPTGLELTAMDGTTPTRPTALDDLPVIAGFTPTDVASIAPVATTPLEGIESSASFDASGDALDDSPATSLGGDLELLDASAASEDAAGAAEEPPILASGTDIEGADDGFDLGAALSADAAIGPAASGQDVLPLLVDPVESLREYGADEALANVDLDAADDIALDEPAPDTDLVLLDVGEPAVEAHDDEPVALDFLATEPIELGVLDAVDDDAEPLVQMGAESLASEVATVAATGADDDPEPRRDALATAARLTPRGDVALEVPAADELLQRLEHAPDDWGLRRRYAESLLEAGERASGLAQLEGAMLGFEGDGRLDDAVSIADQLVRLVPESVAHHQKRVEYAVRANDRARLITAYVELADALLRSGEPGKSHAVFRRATELAPGDPRALAGLRLFEPVSRPTPRTPPAVRRETPLRTNAIAAPQPSPTPPLAQVAASSAVAGEDFVDLGQWLRAEQSPKSTRMYTSAPQPTGDEDADFAEMLRRFKQGVAANVDAEDSDSHYDLGIAYREMGLTDEAIADFQKALRGAAGRLRTYEALGQCFLDKRQYEVAATVLARAAESAPGDDHQLVGVLYLSGYAAEALQRWREALGFYQRVFAVDIQFRDVAERLTAMERLGK
jgi:tetratricopeptide (TPR) repeat protein